MTIIYSQEDNPKNFIYSGKKLCPVNDIEHPPWNNLKNSLGERSLKKKIF